MSSRHRFAPNMVVRSGQATAPKRTFRCSRIGRSPTTNSPASSFVTVVKDETGRPIYCETMTYKGAWLVPEGRRHPPRVVSVELPMGGFQAGHG